MATGLDAEYLHAKERALLMLGVTNSQRMPSNRMIKEYIGRYTKAELGEVEHQRRLQEMREIALGIMTALEPYDPFLIGSTRSGKIRLTSDVDIHAYCDDYEELKQVLSEWGYDEAEEELVENAKGSFVHLKWLEKRYPVEVTIYPWSWREIVLYSSITKKPMKRLDIAGVQALLR